MLNGAIGGLVAITAACAFVAPWAAIVIGLGAGVVVVLGVLLVERIGLDDPIGAVAAHGLSGVWGTLCLGFLTVPSMAEKLATGTRRPLLRRRHPPARDAGARARRRRCVHVHRVVPHALADEGDDRDPGGARGRERRPRRLRARHVGLPGVLHPGARRLRLGGHAPARSQVRRPRGDRRRGRARRQHVRRADRQGRGRQERRDRRRAQLGTLKAGEFFGEMSIFEGEVRSATVRAVGEANILEVDKKTVEKRLGRTRTSPSTC